MVDSNFCERGVKVFIGLWAAVKKALMYSSDRTLWAYQMKLEYNLMTESVFYAKKTLENENISNQICPMFQGTNSLKNHGKGTYENWKEKLVKFESFK